MNARNLIPMFVIGCSASPPATPRELPARPPIGAPIDRVGRALTGNALIGLSSTDEVADARKEQYNRAGPADWQSFAPDLAPSLALYDGFDGTCGNQWRPGGAAGYEGLARLLADDRLWIDSRVATCTEYLAVERGIVGDCGGRTPLYDSVDVFRSLLVLGQPAGVEDGLAHDDHTPSATAFPFLVAP